MTQLEFNIRAICRRRGVVLKTIQSVAFNMRCSFGLANLTELLPAVASTFYYVSEMQIDTVVAQVTNPVRLRATDLGGGSTGVNEFNTSLALTGLGYDIQPFETDSLLYIVNGNTAGTICLRGIVFKITYSA